MSSGLHRELVPSERHAPHSFEYADQEAREGASGLVAGDVGKLALQTDDNSVWLLTAVTPTWLQLTPGAGLATKAGRKLAADFTGSPMQAAVVFSTAFPDTDYGITLTAEGSSNKHWSPQYDLKTTDGFTIKLGSNDKTHLVEVSWQATADGEA